MGDMVRLNAVAQRSTETDAKPFEVETLTVTDRQDALRSRAHRGNGQPTAAAEDAARLCDSVLSRGGQAE